MCVLLRQCCHWGTGNGLFTCDTNIMRILNTAWKKTFDDNEAGEVTLEIYRRKRDVDSFLKLLPVDKEELIREFAKHHVSS